MTTSYVDQSNATPTPQQRALASLPTSIYRYYDGRNVLLYVGITSRGMDRNREHNSTKEWWKFVARQEVEHYPNRKRAGHRERELIRTYRPPFNTMHNPSHEKARSAYLTLLASGKPANFLEWSRENLPASRKISLTARPLDRCLLLKSNPEDAAVVDHLDIQTRSNFRLETDGHGGEVVMISRARSILAIRIEVDDAIIFRNGHLSFRLPHIDREVPYLEIKRIIAVPYPNRRATTS